jgi:hypothetical protein
MLSMVPIGEWTTKVGISMVELVQNGLKLDLIALS